MTTSVKKIRKAELAKQFGKATSKSKKNPSAFTRRLKLISIRIKPKKGATRWVAIDSRNKIISEGSNPNSVSKKAEKITANFSLAFIPKEDLSYVL